MTGRQDSDGTRDDETRVARRRGGQFARAPRPRMEDTTEAPARPQRAMAEAELGVAQETLSSIVDGTNQRGDVLAVAELAGVMAGKRAAELLPLVHQAALTSLVVEAVPDRAAGAIRIRVETAATTASEVAMQALTAAAVAALAAYDMVRDVDPAAAIRNVRLVSISDQHGEWHRPAEPDDRTRPRGARAAGRPAGRRTPGPGSYSGGGRRHSA